MAMMEQEYIMQMMLTTMMTVMTPVIATGTNMVVLFVTERLDST